MTPWKVNASSLTYGIDVTGDYSVRWSHSKVSLNGLIPFQLIWWADFTIFLCWAPEFPSLCRYDKIPNQKQLKKEFIWLKARQELEAASQIHNQEQKEVNTCVQAPSLHLHSQDPSPGTGAPALGPSPHPIPAPLSAFRTVSHITHKTTDRPHWDSLPRRS